MQLRLLEPKGKLDAMTGYSFSTPVWDGRTWVRPVVAGVTATARIVNGPEDQPHQVPVQWDRIDWRAQGGQGRRAGGGGFSAGRGGGGPQGAEPPAAVVGGRG